MNASGHPQITVAMPAFNSAGYIERAIDSVLAQTWADFELLLVDDGSSDSTLDVMRRYAEDARVRVIALSRNHGRPYARTLCLEQAQGEYIAMLDADDWCEPERLARQLAYLRAHPDISVLGSWSKRVDADGQPLPDGMRHEPIGSDAVRCEMLFSCPIHNPTVLARTATLREYGYDEHFRHAEDYDLWTRMNMTCRMANLPVKLTSYRRHATQATAADELSIDGDWQAIHARQLTALGVTFNTQDLQYHALLHRGRRHFLARTGRPMNMAYIRWARAWLEALVRANAQHGHYPETVFARVVGQIWWSLCRKAARQIGRQVWGEFARSSLLHAALLAGRERAVAWLLRNFRTDAGVPAIRRTVATRETS